MPRGSEALTNARKEEIVDACAQLYATMDFKDVTIREIGKVTSCTRTSIYNYFETKEEIFLALLQREYVRWGERLRAVRDERDRLTRIELAEALAHSLEDREIMLKLLSTNLNEVEENSRLERLVEFKTVYARSIESVRNLLDALSPAMDDTGKDAFVRLVFPFVFGIYPYAKITSKQRAAMQQAGMDVDHLPTIYDIAFAGIVRLLGDGANG